VVVTAPTDVMVIDGAVIRSLSDEMPGLRDALRQLAAARGRGETP
jgi:hypothetical protein